MTTYTGPTPWDEVLAALGSLEDVQRASEHDWNLARVQHLAEGYRRAKAEDAPLLKAAIAVDAFHGPDAHMTTCATQPTWASGRDSQGPCDCCYGALRSAIAQTMGKE